MNNSFIELKKILFLTPYPHSTAPSQRFRFEQYFSYLIKSGFKIKIQSFIDEATWKILYDRGKTTQKAWGIVKGFLRRFTIFLTLFRYDFIFIHREASPIGPPVFEWLIAKVFRKKIIYDFDDAIWIPNTSEQNKIAARLKWHQKVGSICRWSYKVSAGNEYLAKYALEFNPNVIINPTTIDTENVHNLIKHPLPPTTSESKDVEQKQLTDKCIAGVQRNNLLPLQGDSKNQSQCFTLPTQNEEDKIIIGWTGSHSTLQYLHEIIPLLSVLEKDFNIQFQVISNIDPKLPLKDYKFIKWNKQTEIEDLFQFDIGLMPLEDTPWAKGKCGFKGLQYMALGLPALVSPVGVNIQIVEDGINGYICSTQNDWLRHLTSLINNPQLRKQIGKAARKTVEERYSVKSNSLNFLNLFQ